MADIRDRVIEVRKMRLGDCVPNEKNWRKHPAGQRDGYKSIAEKIGFAGTLLARVTEDGRVKLIDGHMRQGTHPDLVAHVAITDLSEAEANAILATFDPLAGLAETDNAALEQLLREVDSAFGDLDGLLAEIADQYAVALDEAQPAGDPGAQLDRAEELRKQWGTERGQLWVIRSATGKGVHRLLCGDSTNADDVGRVMEGERADCVFTDPPYNIASENDVIASDVSPSMNALKNASWDQDFDLRPFLDLTLKNTALNATIYVCTSHHLAPVIWAWMGEWSTHHEWCVWNKPNPMPSLMKRHWTWNAELVCYATRGKHVFNFPDDGHALSVWTFTKHKDTQHPTEKPVEVPAHAIRHSSAVNAIVYDGFGGSGTTMVACEQLARQCRMLELEPKYVAVILQRMKDMGLEPELRSGQ